MRKSHQLSESGIGVCEIAAARGLEHRQGEASSRFGHAVRHRDGDPGLVHDELGEQGHDAGVLVRECTSGDLHALSTDTALVLEHGGRPPRHDDDRRTEFILGGICRTP